MDEQLEKLRHSTSHVMAQAIKRLWPEAKLDDGPPTEEGFFYDIDCPTPVTEEDFSKIEAEMKKIVKEGHAFKQSFMSRKEAAEFFKKMRRLISDMIDFSHFSLREVMVEHPSA